MKQIYVNIILPVPLKRTFTYSVPGDLHKEIEIGKRVKVPFGHKKIITGLILEITDVIPSFKTKAIISLLDNEKLVNAFQLKLWQWISSYYLCGLGEVMQAALPKLLKTESKSLYRLNNDITQWDQILDHLKTESRDRSKHALLIIKKLDNVININEKQIQSFLNIIQVRPLIKWMLDNNWILREEQFKEKNIYKKQKVFSSNFNFKEIEKILNEIKRAPKQIEIICYLCENNIKTGLISELKNKLRCSTASINTLQTKGYISISEEVVKDLKENEVLKPLPTLSAIQKKAYDKINSVFNSNKVCLLKGITSSGKTYIYFYLIKRALERNEQVLYLLPEIAITTQIITKIKCHFGNHVWVYHSKLNNRERALVWKEMISGVPGIVIGVRSSVFLPFIKLGLIVVDEEHDFSYKQQDPSPRYNARDVAIVLANLHKANVVLGSATPSVESFYNAKSNKYEMVEINKRYGGIELPEIVLVGLRNELKKGEQRPMISKYLLKEIMKSLNKNMQVILFQNRRGYVPYFICEDCGAIPKCLNCDISLTHHKQLNRLSCHYCGYSKKATNICLSCESEAMKSSGFGTEKIEEYLQILFPDHNIGRLDFDTTRTKRGGADIIKAFENGDIDILIGTQMLTKGLDFENVSLVGILNAESLMNFPDFRANERAFNMMLQVAGRAGRKKTRGKVMIQAVDIKDKVLQMVLHNQVHSFIKEELEYRKIFLYPPYYRLIKIYLRSEQKQILNDCAELLAIYLKAIKYCEVLGPEMSLTPRLKGNYVKQILLKMNIEKVNLRSTKTNIEKILSAKQFLTQYRRVKISVDVDPI